MAEKETSEVIFAKQKQACLAGTDFSRKGSIDEAICSLVNYINMQENLVTTSSCSGRIAVFSYPSGGEVKKKGCKWLHISHDYCTSENVMSSLQKCQGDVFFKFEAFILHVQCSNLEHAQKLMSTAVSSGFRNSGISVSNKGKVVVAVRSTHSLEVPLTHEGKLLVTEEYIEYLVELGNNKMKENFQRIERFFHNLKKMMSEEQAPAVKKNFSGAAKRKKRMGKRTTEGDTWQSPDSRTHKHKMENELPSIEGVNLLFNSKDEKIKQGPLPRGFVSLNKVTSLKFTTHDKECEKHIEAACDNVQTSEPVQLSADISNNYCSRKDDYSNSIEHKNFENSTCMSNACQPNHHNDLQDSSDLKFAIFSCGSMTDGDDKVEKEDTSSVTDSAHSASGQGDSSIVNSQCETFVEYNNTDKTFSQKETKSLKGITGVTIIPPGSTEISEVRTKAVILEENIEDMLNQTLNLKS